MANEKIIGSAPDISYFNAKSRPFSLYGLCRDENGYVRIPENAAALMGEGISFLSKETAGGRIRFSTDSPYIAIKVKMPYVTRFNHMPQTGTTSFDLYVETDGGSQFVRTFVRPDTEFDDGYTAVCRLENSKMRNFTLCFPPFNAVDSLYIGIGNGYKLTNGLPYFSERPVVFYGSSITQGACSSRPGLNFENVISRKYNLDYINLGFSGCAKAEEPMVNYINSLDMLAFVTGYDHNAKDAEYLFKSALAMYKTIRESHENMPYIMFSRPDFAFHKKEDSVARRDAIIDVFREAVTSGDKNVYYIDGEGIFRGPDCNDCTVDGTHPNDIGMLKIAKKIGCVLEEALRG